MRITILVSALMTLVIAANAWMYFQPATSSPVAMRFVPVSWPLAKEGGGWVQAWKGGWVQVYSQVQPDDRRSVFRFEFDVINESTLAVFLNPEAMFVRDGEKISGEVLRLFEPQSLSVEPSIHAEFAVLFALGAPLSTLREGGIRIKFGAHDTGKGPFELELALQHTAHP